MAERQTTLARHTRRATRQDARPSTHGSSSRALSTGARGQSARGSGEQAGVERPSPEDIAFADFLNGAWGTAVEACRYLPVSLSVLRRETRRGRIKAYVVGGRKLIRYRRSDLDAYLEAQAVAVPVSSRKRA